MAMTTTMMAQPCGSSAWRHAVIQTAGELNMCSRRRPSSRTMTTTVALAKRRPAVRCRSSLRDDSCGGGAACELVDDGMPVLRRRILEMKAAAAAVAEYDEEDDSSTITWNDETTPEDVEWHWRGGGQLFHALRGSMMAFSSRPGVAVGIVVFLVASVPASAFLALCSRLLAELQQLHHFTMPSSVASPSRAGTA